jgi:hypothetical protein
LHQYQTLKNVFLYRFLKILISSSSSSVYVFLFNFSEVTFEYQTIRFMNLETSSYRVCVFNFSFSAQIRFVLDFMKFGRKRLKQKQMYMVMHANIQHASLRNCFLNEEKIEGGLWLVSIKGEAVK